MSRQPTPLTDEQAQRAIDDIRKDDMACPGCIVFNVYAYIERFVHEPSRYHVNMQAATLLDEVQGYVRQFLHDHTCELKP